MRSTCTLHSYFYKTASKWKIQNIQNICRGLNAKFWGLGIANPCKLFWIRADLYPSFCLIQGDRNYEATKDILDKSSTNISPTTGKNDWMGVAAESVGGGCPW